MQTVVDTTTSQTSEPVTIAMGFQMQESDSQLASLGGLAQKWPKEGFWRQHVNSYRSSGQTIEDYAQEHGLQLFQLYYWQRKL